LDHKDANEHIEKVLEIVDLFHIPNITEDQVMLRVFPMSLTGAASRFLRNKPSGSITTWEDLKTKFLNKYCPPARTAKKMEEINNFQQEPDETLYQAWERSKELLMKYSKGVIPSKTAADAKVAIQEMVEYSQKWHNGTSRTRMNEKVYVAQVGCEQCKGPHYTKDCPLKEEGKTLEESYYTQFGAPFQGGGYRAAAPGFYQRNNANPSYQERRQTIEEDLEVYLTLLIKEIRASMGDAIRNQGASIKTLEIQIGQMSKGSYGPQLLEAYSSKALHIDNSIPKKEKDPRSFTLPCFINNVCFDNALADSGASVNMPEDVKVSLIIERPFLSTAHAKIDVFKRKITLRVGEESVIFKSVKLASSLIKRVYMLSLRERIELDLEARLMGETFVLNRSLDPLNGDYIELNGLNEPLELRRNQVDNLIPTVKEGEVIDAPMDDLVKPRNDKLDTGIDDYPIGCDYEKKICIDYFVVLEDMDVYRDEGICDVIVGESFLKEI
ncbi:ribonuclease H-like domain, reverse transcriptase, RNA-dependent DNA polymerase, partial [Tanacetum coccineum]